MQRGQSDSQGRRIGLDTIEWRVILTAACLILKRPLRGRSGRLRGDTGPFILHVDWPLIGNGETMAYFARLWSRDSRRRPASARYVLEALEGRTMLSGAGASQAAAQANISSMTALTASLNTAVTGTKLIFTATVENSSNDAPVTSGKVHFVVDSPKKIVLGDVNVTNQGEARIASSQLTDIANYRVEAQYIPTKSNISASVSAPTEVKVIPVPLNVPTVTTLTSPATLAEAGQHVPLVATVTDAGTGVDVNAGLVEPITGTVAFVTDSPNPIVLGEAKLNGLGQASISSDLLQNVGVYQIKAEFLPANNYFAESTSAPIPFTITPRTVNAPTVTTLQAVTSTVETGEPFTFNATVQNSNSSLAGGFVKFVTVSPRPVVLGEVPVGAFDQQVSLGTFALKKVGTYQVQATYVPSTNRFAESTSAPVTVTVTPLTAVSFRVTPLVRRGHLAQPVTFTVTALNAHKQPVTNYTGTVTFSSPTDSWTIFPTAVYVSLDTAPPPANSPQLATFANMTYTFTPADHGTHLFVDAATFNKGGAEILKVSQANNTQVSGKATFSIG